MTSTHEPDDPARSFIRELGQRVKAGRQAAGLSQSRLERDAGLRPTTITTLERGQHDIDMYDLHRIAQALGTEMTTLIPAGQSTSTAPDQPGPA
jgi:transcriptional regulator with XRE-family HTH domain